MGRGSGLTEIAQSAGPARRICAFNGCNQTAAVSASVRSGRVSGEVCACRSHERVLREFVSRARTGNLPLVASTVRPPLKDSALAQLTGRTAGESYTRSRSGHRGHSSSSDGIGGLIGSIFPG
jgi:hypothetical protein